jgi:ATP-dependent DNA helicase RecG
MDLNGPLTQIKGIGGELAKQFAKLQINTLYDLLLYFPKKYDDFSDVMSIRDMKPGQVCIKARIHAVNSRYVRRGMHITEALASDETGSVKLIWFNQPFRANSIKGDTEYFIVGKFDLSRGRFSINSPTIEADNDFTVNTARIVPRYKESKTVGTKLIRRSLRDIFTSGTVIPESLPSDIVKSLSLMPYKNVLKELHFPTTLETFQKAKRRMAFEELFTLQLSAQLTKRQIKLIPSISVPFTLTTAQRFVKHLPFNLTDAQRRTLWQIFQDMEGGDPMNRLVEGDVGSGKTVVAAMAAAMVLESGHQAAFMAPTSILARQHFESLKTMLEPLGYGDSVLLLEGSSKKTHKETVLQKVGDGKPLLLVGTHALIHANYDLSQLALIIVDEQHRFGVEQRRALIKRAGHMPHMLSMTATPIPRTLALLAYGELDISLLNELPKGRKAILTHVYTESQRRQAYEQVIEEISAGRQAFVVCPVIEESEEGRVSVQKTYDELKKKTLKGYKVALMHGRLKNDEKESVMRDYVNKKYDVLVATTVIEVGVNVPNATVMVIEGADFYGLAQLHQLRGRVGRSDLQSHCLAITSQNQVSQRLRAFQSSQDGFELAEYDLELRGPGALYGTRQHGSLDLRFVELSDKPLIAAAKKQAIGFLGSQPNMVKYPQILAKIEALQKVTNLN